MKANTSLFSPSPFPFTFDMSNAHSVSACASLKIVMCGYRVIGLFAYSQSYGRVVSSKG